MPLKANKSHSESPKSIVSARVKHVPVLINGHVASAAAAVSNCFKPTLIHFQIAHYSAQPPHCTHFVKFGKMPIVDLGTRLGWLAELSCLR